MCLCELCFAVTQSVLSCVCMHELQKCDTHKFRKINYISFEYMVVRWWYVSLRACLCVSEEDIKWCYVWLLSDKTHSSRRSTWFQFNNFSLSLSAFSNSNSMWRRTRTGTDNRSQQTIHASQQIVLVKCRKVCTCTSLIVRPSNCVRTIVRLALIGHRVRRDRQYWPSVRNATKVNRNAYANNVTSANRCGWRQTLPIVWQTVWSTFTMR